MTEVDKEYEQLEPLDKMRFALQRLDFLSGYLCAKCDPCDADEVMEHVHIIRRYIQEE